MMIGKEFDGSCLDRHRAGSAIPGAAARVNLQAAGFGEVEQ